MRKIHIKEGEFAVIEVVREAAREWATIRPNEYVSIKELFLSPSRDSRDGVAEFYNVELRLVVDSTVEVLMTGRVFDESQGDLATKAASDPLRERLIFVIHDFRFPGRDQKSLESSLAMHVRRGLNVYSSQGATMCLRKLLEQ